MRKAEALQDEKSALNQALNEEIIFVLRAKDQIAPEAVRWWAMNAKGIHERAKIDEALILALNMEEQRPLLLAGDMEPAATLADPREQIARFAAWLSARATPITISANHECGELASLVKQYCDERSFPRG